MITTPTSPYKGLNGFEDSELDALLFFGREREREIVVANLIASRLTVLYGPSGVGKSSLLRAAVARTLRALPEEPLVVVFSRWSDDPAKALAATIAEAAGAGGAESNGSAFDALASVQSDRDLYLVLDQAEEYFLYHADDGGPGSFAEALPAILAEPYRVNVLLSLREDSLAKLDRFTGRIPGIFANTLRLDRLDRSAARAAIVGPVEQFADLTGRSAVVEPELIERVLNEVGTGRIEPALGGLGGVEAVENGARIEAPYLQLVMQRVWDEEQALHSNVLRAETLDRLGGAQHIVEEHLEGAMAQLASDQRDIAARLFNHLVTPSGTKIAHEVSDLADFGGVPVEELRPVLDTLAERRILRSLEEGGGLRYEIFHDVLAQPVLAWRSNHEAERALERERVIAHRKQRRTLAFAAAASVVAAAMVAVTAFAVSQRSEAEEQAANAQVARAEAVRQASLANAEEAEAERQRANAERERAKAEGEKANAQAAQEEAQEQAENAAVAQRQAETNEQRAEASAAQAQEAQQQAEASASEAQRARKRAQTAAANADLQRTKAQEAAAAAKSAASQARARALAERANALLQIRPLESLRLATAAARREPDSRLAERVLRAALAASRVRAVLPGGGGPVTAASFSPDSRLVLTVAQRARIFDAGTGAPLRTLNDPASVTAASFSPDGRMVATAGADGGARLWAIEGAARVRSDAPTVLSGHRKAVEDVAFSDDGRLLVTASVDRTAIVWRTGTGERVSTLRHDGPVRSAVFSPDGSLVMTVSHVGRPARFLARLFDASSGDALVTFDARGIRSATFSPDGSFVVTTGNDDRTRIWDPDTGAALAVLVQDEDVVSAAFSTDGKKLATATAGGTAFIWEVGTWKREQVLAGPLNPLTGASFSPDGRFLVVSSRDRTARVFRADNGLEVTMLAGHGESVVAASYAPNGRWIVSASHDGTARIWDPGTANLLQLVGKENGGAIRRASFSPDGRLAVSASADGTARILLVDRRRELEVLRHDKGVNDAEFSPDGELVVTASDDETARIWRVNGKLVRALPHQGPVLRAIFSPDGTLLATASVDRMVRLWRARDGRLLHTLRGHEDGVLDVAFSPSGRLVATAGDVGDRTARIWRIDGKQLHVLRHRGPIVRVSFSPNGRLVLTASGDEMARLWRVDTGKLRRLLRGHTDFVRDARFSRNGKFVVTVSDDHDGRIWSVATGETVSILRGHLRVPQAASFSRDGRWVVTAGGIAAGLWDTSTGRFFAPTGLTADPFMRGHAAGPLTSAVFSPDGKRILTAAGDGTVRTYLCELCGGLANLIRLAEDRRAALEKELTPAERRRYLRG